MSRQKAMQSRRMLSWMVLAALLLLLGCATYTAMALPPKPNPELLRVTVYTWGLLTNSRSVDLAAGRLTGIGFLGRDGEGTSKYTVSVPKAELATLSEAIREMDLYNNPPKPEWFKGYWQGKRVCHDGGSVIAFHWKNRELALAMPPDDVLPRLPKAARAYYRNVDAVWNKMYALRTKYVQKSMLVKITDRNSPDIEQLHKEMEQAHLVSVPQGRKDWGW